MVLHRPNVLVIVTATCLHKHFVLLTIVMFSQRHIVPVVIIVMVLRRHSVPVTILVVLLHARNDAHCCRNHQRSRGGYGASKTIRVLAALVVQTRAMVRVAVMMKMMAMMMRSKTDGRGALDGS